MGHGGFAPRGWDTPQQGRGPRCSPRSSQCWKSPQLTRHGAAKTLTPWRQSPPYEPFHGQPLRDGARREPRDPIAGLWGGFGSSQTGAADPKGPNRSPGGRRSGCPAAAGAARTRARGRDEADQRQACRRWFIGDAQRLWQYATPPPQDGEAARTPPLAPSWPLTSSCRGSSPLGVWSWHMLGWAPPQPKC